MQIRWVNEGNSVGFMPTRYPGDATLQDPQCALSRKTQWNSAGSDFFTGSGQRMFTTDSNDFSLLQTRKIVFEDIAESSDTVSNDV